jgi:hypothetical protein
VAAGEDQPQSVIGHGIVRAEGDIRFVHDRELLQLRLLVLPAAKHVERAMAGDRSQPGRR